MVAAADHTVVGDSPSRGYVVSGLAHAEELAVIPRSCPSLCPECHGMKLVSRIVREALPTLTVEELAKTSHNHFTKIEAIACPRCNGTGTVWEGT